MFFSNKNEQIDLNLLSLRLLAGLGDAVCSLIERERAISLANSAKQLHSRAKEKVNAQAQAIDLDRLIPFLNEKELDIVRRGVNLKLSNYGRTGQSVARKANAYEILLGYLYLADLNRLKELVDLLSQTEQNKTNVKDSF